jgi:hypothetical protein
VICVKGLIQQSGTNYDVDDVVKFEKIQESITASLGIRVKGEFKSDLEKLLN